MYRIVGGCRPLYVLVENVSAIRTRGADRVIGDLESLGYTVAPPMVIGADDIGAPHKRKRAWFVARLGFDDDGRRFEYNYTERRFDVSDSDGFGRASEGRRRKTEDAFAASNFERLADRNRDGREQFGRQERVGEETGVEDAPAERGRRESGRENLRIMADPGSAGREERHAPALAARAGHGAGSDAARWPARPGQPQHEWEPPRLIESRDAEFQMGRNAHELPGGLDGSFIRRLADRVHRSPDAVAEWWKKNQMIEYRAWNRCALKAAGNSVVPAVVEVIGRAILRTEMEMRNERHQI